MGRGMQSPALPASGPVWHYRVNGREFRKTFFGILISTSRSFWRIRIAVRGGSAACACTSLIFQWPAVVVGVVDSMVRHCQQKRLLRRVQRGAS